MSSTKKYRASARHVALCLVMMIAAAMSASSAWSQAQTAPENSYLTNESYGQGWKCHRGFRERNGQCEAFSVPTNGHLTSYGDSWECDRGYRKNGRACDRIKVPENAYLTSQGYGGKGWTCERGYREAGRKCVVIVVPKNAYLTESGRSDGWVCERGYGRDGNNCVMISLPKNAHLNYDGNGWDCNEPLKKQDGACIRP